MDINEVANIGGLEDWQTQTPQERAAWNAKHILHKNKQPSKHHLCLYVSQELMARMRRVTERLGVPMSYIATEGIKKQLELHEAILGEMGLTMENE